MLVDSVAFRRMGYASCLGGPAHVATKILQLVEPIAMATATVLMCLTFLLFVIAERFRSHQGGGF